jgi:hypothetical protein
MIGAVDSRRAAARLAPLALTPAAALVVHELRYVLAYGGGASRELERQGHAYLHSLAPWVVLLIALVIGSFLRELGRALRGQASLPRYTLSLGGLWLACAASLIAIYVGQEMLEGLLATGHPGGLAGVLGYGGWWAIPIAACVGLVLAVVLHGARWVLGEVARRRCAPQWRRTRRVSQLRPVLELRAAAAAPLAAGWSRRGPPA